LPYADINGLEFENFFGLVDRDRGSVVLSSYEYLNRLFLGSDHSVPEFAGILIANDPLFISLSNFGGLFGYTDTKGVSTAYDGSVALHGFLNDAPATLTLFDYNHDDVADQLKNSYLIAPGIVSTVDYDLKSGGVAVRQDSYTLDSVAGVALVMQNEVVDSLVRPVIKQVELSPAYSSAEARALPSAIEGNAIGELLRSASGLLTTIEAAEYLRLSPRTLEDMRVTGNGPHYYKLGPGKRSKVVYRREDLESWAQRFSFGSTSEYTVKPGRPVVG